MHASTRALLRRHGGHRIERRRVGFGFRMSSRQSASSRLTFEPHGRVGRGLRFLGAPGRSSPSSAKQKVVRHHSWFAAAATASMTFITAPTSSADEVAITKRRRSASSSPAARSRASVPGRSEAGVWRAVPAARVTRSTGRASSSASRVSRPRTSLSVPSPRRIRIDASREDDGSACPTHASRGLKSAARRARSTQRSSRRPPCD